MNRTICQRHTRAGSGRRQRESKGQRSRDGATVTPAWRCNGVGSSHRGRSEAFVQTGWQGRGLGGSLPFQLGFTLYLQATSSQWPTCLRKGQPRPSPPVSATLPCLPRRGENSITPQAHVQRGRMEGRQLEGLFKTLVQEGKARTPVACVFPHTSTSGGRDSAGNRQNCPPACDTLRDPGDIP